MRASAAMLLNTLFAISGFAAQAQTVAADPGLDRLPELHQDLRPVADRDLLPVLAVLNAQHTLDHVHPPGLSSVTVPAQLDGAPSQMSLVVIATVLRTEARMTPDLTGVATVLTVLPSAKLFEAKAQTSSGPRAQPQTSPPFRRTRGATPPQPPPLTTPVEVQSGDLLRFVLPGGTVYFDDNNAIAVRQAGVSYPPPGAELVLAGKAVNGSSALLLAAACVLRQGACQAIDGGILHTDAYTANLPGGLQQAQAMSIAGAPIARPENLGITGVAGSLESRYSLCLGDLRRIDQALPRQGCAFPAAQADATLVRASVFSSTAALTSTADGLVETSIVSVSKVVLGGANLVLRRGSVEVTQRGGLLLQANGSVLAQPEKLRPLIPGADYFLELGRTSDNRWEAIGAWRILGGHVYAMDWPRAVVPASAAFWKSEAAFINAATGPG